MKKIIFNRLMLFGSCIALLTLALATFATAQSSSSGNVKTQITKVNVIGSTAVVPQAGASLSRNNDAVLGEISTSGLTPGHVTTVWWSIFNNPEFCANPACAASDFNNPAVNGSLQLAGGTIADVGGRMNLSGYLAVGDNTGFYLNPAFPNMPNPAPGIVSTKKAQIHLAVRTHGVASSDPTILQQQLTSFPGGCAVSVPSPCATIQVAPFLQPSLSVAQSADFDGDGRSDISVFRPSDGTWHIMESDTNNYRVQSFGLSGDKIVPGDYDGDERTDFAVYRPSTGVWYVLRSSDSSVSTIQWGLAKDKPAPADYDGDGRTDIAVYRDGAWYIVQSSDGSFSYQQFGLSSDIPIAASAQ
jgi:hypothetical protein